MSLAAASFTDAELRDMGIPTAERHCAGCGELAQESNLFAQHCQPCAEALVGIYVAVPDTRIQIGPLDI